MASLMDRLAEEGSVSLEAYGHQVGGHQLMLKFGDTLCKPVNEREHFFYATIPDKIKRYIPGYFGVINVNFERTPSNEIKALATVKKDQVKPHPPSVGLPQQKLPKCSTGRTIHNGDDILAITTNIEGEDEDFMNPWATVCNEIMDKKLSEMGGLLNDFSVDCMVLENLTSKYTSPSVLDLKVGTRQHGDDSTPSMVARRMYSCAISTSRTLGVRMAGLQKFDVAKNEYVFIDKYFGKQLTAEDFAEILTFFLYNGSCFRHDLLPSIVKMLQDIQESVKTLSSYRYFSSSLLLIYDGAECPKGLDEEACMRGKAVEDRVHEILTRAKCAEKMNAFDKHEAAKNGKVKSNGYNGDSASNGDSAGNEKSAGLSSSHNHHMSKTEIPLGNSETILKRICDADQCGETQPFFSTTSERHHESELLSGEDLSRIRSNVDLRMIDFAHSTHSGFSNDPVTYEGPDDSYLTGLDSLISLFQNMYVER